MRALLVAIALAAFLASSADPRAQAFPTRPITMVVPFAAGGPNDTADPATQARFADIGQETASRHQHTPEALGAWHTAKTTKWWPIIKAANVKIE
jgi:hypothetical protein